MNGNSLKDNGAKLMNLAHRLVLKASGNRLLAQPFGMPLVELHTTGRKTGKLHGASHTPDRHTDRSGHGH
jgi:hypothetical protein